MATIPIRIYGDPILRKKAAPISNIDEQIGSLVDRMIQTMCESEGAGLAAPQVGESIALIVLNLSAISGDDSGTVRATAMINPEIEESRGECVHEEGCLSVLDIREDVIRPEEILVFFEDMEGRRREFTCNGMLARVIQHEIDHLNGVLFVDRVSPLKRQLLRGKLKKMAKRNGA